MIYTVTLLSIVILLFISTTYAYYKTRVYDSFIRTHGYGNTYGYSLILKCNGTILDKFMNVPEDNPIITTETYMYISAITADEIVYATDKLSMWTYGLDDDVMYSNNAFLPALSLMSGVTLDSTISGENGTQKHPYVIS